jgi:hypothetical protein
MNEGLRTGPTTFVLTMTNRASFVQTSDVTCASHRDIRSPQGLRAPGRCLYEAKIVASLGLTRTINCARRIKDVHRLLMIGGIRKSSLA